MSRTSLRGPLKRPTAHHAAASWALRLEHGDLSDAKRAELERWLVSDESNARALNDANWALDAVAGYAGSPELMELRERALAARGERGSRRWTWIGAGGAVAASLIAALILISPGPLRQIATGGQQPAVTDYRTAVGQRAAIALPDGSVATLDTDSALEVAYGDTERAVHLTSGQALFEVAKAPRKFVVYAKGQRITAVGTVFNVRIEGERVKVALIEGVVRVKSPVKHSETSAGPMPEKDLTLAAGELLTAAPAQPLKVQSANVEDLSSWKRGLLVFNDIRLADAVEEVNRYNEEKLRIADVALADLRLSGVFKSNDPRRFAEAMVDLFPIEAATAGDGTHLLKPANRLN